MAGTAYIHILLLFIFVDLKDDNIHLRERNHALVGYIDTLLLNIIESKPDILEVKPFQSNTSLSANNSVTV